MGGLFSKPPAPPPTYSQHLDESTLKWLGEHPWATQGNVQRQFGNLVPTYDWGAGTMSAPGQMAASRIDKYAETYGGWGRFVQPSGGIDYNILDSHDYVPTQELTDSIVKDNPFLLANRYNKLARGLMGASLLGR